MKTTIIPEKIIPAKYMVTFFESNEYADYIIEPEPYNKQLSKQLTNWLNRFAPNWEVDFDCGDWGEGPALVTIFFKEEWQSHKFSELFCKIPCPNSESFSHCPMMISALSSIDRQGDGKGKCLRCGKDFTILTEANHQHFFKDIQMNSISEASKNEALEVLKDRILLSEQLEPEKLNNVIESDIPFELFDTSSKEYVEWMANIWKMNDERNKKHEQNKKRMQLLDDIAASSREYDDECD